MRSLVFLFAFVSFSGHARYDSLLREAQVKFPEDHLVILQDEITLDFNQMNPASTLIIMSRTALYHVRTEFGVKRMWKMVLPESLDPLYDQRNIRYGERNEDRPAPYLNTRVTGITAERWMDSTFSALYVHTKRRSEKFLNFQLHENLEYTEAEIANIKQGDLVRISYRVEIPYLKNWYTFNSFRTFFHGSVSSMRKTIRLIHSKSMQTDLGGAVPDSVIIHKQDKITYWTLQNLPACLFEHNTRPDIDLPHIRFLMMQNNNEIFTLDQLSHMRIDLPFWTQPVRMREAAALNYFLTSRRKIVLDRQSKLVFQFMQQFMDSLPAASVPQKFASVHNYIASEFDYFVDEKFLSGKDAARNRLGDRVQEKRLRNITVYDLYVKMLFRLRSPFLSLYQIDKRIGTKDRIWHGNLLMDHFQFVLQPPEGDGAIFIMPKTRRFGYWANEMPFYLEASSGLLARLGFMFRQGIIPETRFFETPSSNFKQNYRTIHAKISLIDGEDMTSAAIKYALSGQYSTICREFLSVGSTDSTVHPDYFILPFQLTARDGRSMKYEMNTDYPFLYQLEGTRRGRWIWTDCNEFMADFDALFPFVLPSAAELTTRTQPFYFDFAGKDTYRYLIELPDSATLKLTDTVIENEVFRFALQAEQRDAGNIYLDISMEVRREKVDGDAVYDLVKVCELVRRWRSAPVAIASRR